MMTVMNNTIILPPGCGAVPAHEIPWRIVEAIYPPAWKESDTLVTLSKKVNELGMCHEELFATAPNENLTDADREELNKVCLSSNLPTVQIGMRVSEYQQCERVFDALGKDWVLVPFTSNTQAYYTLKSAEEHHRTALLEAVSGGDIVLLDGFTRIPLSVPICTEKLRTEIMTVTEFSRYVARFSLMVTFSEAETKQTSKDVFANSVPPRQRRQDALAVELSEILLSSNSHAPTYIMMELKKRIGQKHSCIIGNVGDGIKWMNNAGKEKELNISALSDRIRGWKSKNSLF